ncbi:MAG: CPBP family intramembrane glutamic endopeptidase [Sphingobacterium sp.]
MQQNTTTSRMPLNKILAVLIGFPVISTLISFLLLNRTLITGLGLDFFNTFWIIITVWYLVQLLLILKILKSEGWGWQEIGYTLSKKKTIYFASGYLLVAFALFIMIEMALSNGNVDPQKLHAISSLTPKTTTARIIFILMGLVAGISEEIVYRGFAIRALVSNRINKWLSILIAAVPFIFQHGLKSIDQFWWFLSWGIVFGVLFILLKKLNVLIAIHWLVILSAMVAVLQVVN